MKIEEEIGDLLRKNGLTVGTVESASGGLISNLITNVPGSSDYFKGSVVSYSNEIKTGVVGVDAATINIHGAVSPHTAREMAKGGRKLLGVDICLSDTGIAGPDGGTKTKPVGLFYIGLSSEKGTYSRKRVFTGSREQNKRRAARAALLWLKAYLTRPATSD